MTDVSGDRVDCFETDYSDLTDYPDTTHSNETSKIAARPNFASQGVEFFPPTLGEAETAIRETARYDSNSAVFPWPLLNTRNK